LITLEKGLSKCSGRGSNDSRKPKSSFKEHETRIEKLSKDNEKIKSLQSTLSKHKKTIELSANTIKGKF